MGERTEQEELHLALLSLPVHTEVLFDILIALRLRVCGLASKTHYCWGHVNVVVCPAGVWSAAGGAADSEASKGRGRGVAAWEQVGEINERQNPSGRVESDRRRGGR